ERSPIRGGLEEDEGVPFSFAISFAKSSGKATFDADNVSVVGVGSEVSLMSGRGSRDVVEISSAGGFSASESVSVSREGMDKRSPGVMKKGVWIEFSTARISALTP